VPFLIHPFSRSPLKKNKKHHDTNPNLASGGGGASMRGLLAGRARQGAGAKVRALAGNACGGGGGHEQRHGPGGSAS
jgi:hypothetical protein